MKIGKMFTVLLMILIAITAVAFGEENKLAQTFEDPPDSAKPWAYWWWLDSNASRQGITRDLEEMKRQGIGGVLIFDAGVGGPSAPDGPPFMSREWRELFKFAVEEANRLGIEVSINLCSGWNAGGPWVRPEHAAKKLVWSETVVPGPANINLALPVPPSVDGYYKDEVVVAFRTTEQSTLTASSSYPKYPPELTLDDDPKTRWISNGDKPGQGPTSEHPEYLTWEFLVPFPAASLHITPYLDCGPKDCQLQCSDDGKVFRTICRFVVEERKDKSALFDETRARFFRLVITSSYPYQGQDSWNVQISEISLLKKGQKPALLTAHCKNRDVVDLTSKVDVSGRLTWDAPEGSWMIMRFGHTILGSAIKCVSPGAEGLEIDPLSAEAMNMHFEATAEKCVADVGNLAGKTLKYTHIDSWELGVPNWTKGFLSEFRRRRGYDPLPYLPVLAKKIVDSKDVSNRFLWDYRRTVGDCIADNYYGRLSELSNRHGMGIHPESGGPFFSHWIDALQCLGKSNIPMGEFWARHTEPSGLCWYRDKYMLCDTVKQAASAAHIYGKKYVQAEAFTTMGPNWEKDPFVLKDIGDLAFCAGLTRNMLCFYVHQPYLDIKPGNQWEAAGTHFDRNITWWPQSHAWLKYLTRCQFMLQQGLFVADVCYYYGEDVPNYVPAKTHMKPFLPSGYDCDTINTDVLLNRVFVKDGRIMLPDGMSYSLLVLPNSVAMSVSVLKKVSELAKAGVTLVGTKPMRTQGLRNYPACDEEVRKLAKELNLISGKSLLEILTGIGIPPDFMSRGAPLDFIHRSCDDVDIYFVCNQQNIAVRAECTFRVDGKCPEFWDPVIGKRRDAVAYNIADGRTTIPLELAPRGSLFVVFSRSAKSARGPGTRNFPVWENAQTIDGPWTVKFDPKWGGPESVEFEKLQDWTKRPEKGIKYYSGKATYYKTFDLPKTLPSSGKRIYLDLGRVKNVAQVYLNGKDLGVVWTAPWHVEITEEVKPAGNKLKIEVVNLWPNRLIGDANLPKEKRLTVTNVKKFKVDSRLMESGLLGPVTVQTCRKKTN